MARSRRKIFAEPDDTVVLAVQRPGPVIAKIGLSVISMCSCGQGRDRSADLPLFR
jgi:hypothetical protein